MVWFNFLCVASIFGEQTKLQPMAPDRRARWKKEIDWLLSVTDHIVEFVPSQQISKEGVCTEVPFPETNNYHFHIHHIRDNILIQ